MEVPPSFARNAERTWGQDGRAWAERLPALVRDICDEWNLRITQADFTLSFNFVVPVARADGRAAVLKLEIPGRDFLRELTALEIYNGDGMCALLEQDRQRGAMLLERVQPGVPLVELGEVPEAVSAAVSVMRRLRKPPPPGHAMESLTDWWRGAQAGLRERSGGATGPLPADLVALADEIYTDLASDSSDYVVLHGDLHHWNILSSDRAGWLAIDPHGVLGPPECEVGAFMKNPNTGALVRPDVRQVLARRLDQFAEELGFDRQRLRRLSFAYAMLSATWSADHEGGRWEPTLEIARALLEV